MAKKMLMDTSLSLWMYWKQPIQISVTPISELHYTVYMRDNFDLYIYGQKLEASRRGIYILHKAIKAINEH